jgi:Response regulators consisting of a CheY-like receiver domain and a winged-helix DNA-binding domain
MNGKILLIEDDTDICDLVALYLRREDLLVDLAPDAERGLDMFRRVEYDLLISDIMLPGMDGLQLVRMIRRESDVPIIFMTNKKTSQDIVNGLKLGGDDYVTKPFEPEVLVARVQAGLRRYKAGRGKSGEKADKVWDDGWLSVHTGRLEVFVDSKPVPLPAKELQLLLLLLEHPNQVFSVRQLYEKIWSLDGLSDERTVMVHIHNLRKKIEKDAAKPEYVVTIRGFGYKFGARRRTVERPID